MINWGALTHANVVYNYERTTGNCEFRWMHYTGSKTCTLSHQLIFHLQDGGIKEHLQQEQGVVLTRKAIVENTKIIAGEGDCILQGIYIRNRQMTINTVTLYDGQPIGRR